jgi:hypothetical protein
VKVTLHDEPSGTVTEDDRERGRKEAEAEAAEQGAEPVKIDTLDD